MNSSTPFSVTQQRLILSAVALFILVACWNLVKNYHPRFRRSPIFRYTPLGMLALALAVAALGLIAFYATDFATAHPLRFLAVPLVGLVVFAICAQIDLYREKALPETPGTAAQSRQWDLSKGAMIRLANWYSVALACSLVTIPFSLYGELFGPQRGIVFAIIAFLLSMSVFILSRQPLGIRFLKEFPTGLSGWFPELQRWRKRIERALLPIGFVAFFSVVAMFASSRAGVPSDSLPVFAPREHYVLTNHGRRTEVSAVRFWIASAGGLVAWHCGALLVSLLALYGLFYGELPPQFKREFKRKDAGTRP